RDHIAELKFYLGLACRNSIGHMGDGHIDSVGGDEADRDRLEYVLIDVNAHVIWRGGVVKAARKDAEDGLSASRVTVNASVDRVADQVYFGDDWLRFQKLYRDRIGFFVPAFHAHAGLSARHSGRDAQVQLRQLINGAADRFGVIVADPAGVQRRIILPIDFDNRA